jgi:hypothetical protein
MPTSREKFERIAGGTIIPGIQEFPKLPDCLKKRLNDAEKKEVAEYEEKVQDFFKQQSIRANGL